MPKKRRKLNIVPLILVVLLFGAFVIGFSIKNKLAPLTSQSNLVTVEIQGQSNQQILKQLEENKIIRDSKVAYYYSRFKKNFSPKAGTYEIDTSWSLDQIFSYVSDSKNALSTDKTLKVIEGDWVKHIASKIQDLTGVNQDEILALWNDPQYVSSLQQKYPFLKDVLDNQDIRFKLEGYLAPDTYRIAKDATVEEITEVLLDQTNKIYQSFQNQIEKSSLTVHQIYTLASIVQYEASSVEDMKMIAGVFYNRLKINMPLQSSVTVCYAIDINRGDDWMNCEVNSNFESPYNTYKYPGLPPGPILNPGKDAIDAVLNPTPSDYYYFMADVYGDGKVYYAKTLQEHEENVRKYLK